MEIVINGKAVAVPGRHSEAVLLDFLRDFVGLKGTKFGCGIGFCGACTVHVDGAATRSCQLSVSDVDVDGQEVTTIAGGGLVGESRRCVLPNRCQSRL